VLEFNKTERFLERTSTATNKIITTTPRIIYICCELNMKQSSLHGIQNCLEIFRKQQQQLPTRHLYFTEFVNRSRFGINNYRRDSNYLPKLINMKIHYIHRQTIRPRFISGGSGTSVFLISAVALALNHCPLILSFLQSQSLCPQQRHGFYIMYPSQRVCRLASTTLYASTDESYLPPDYTIDDGNDENLSNSDDVIPTTRRSRPKIIRVPYDVRSKLANNNNNNDMDLIEVDNNDGYVPTSRIMKGKKPKEKKSEPTPAISNSVVLPSKESKKTSASWMDRNNQFMNTVGMTDKNPTKSIPNNDITSSTNRATVRSNDVPTSVSSSTLPISNKRMQSEKTNVITKPKINADNDESNRTFREDFRGTRVFVQGLPASCKWQGLKDHFRIAGNVVFASVSSAIDPNTGQPKGHGIVQFETTAEARNAIRIMRDHPLDGNVLYVREDVQDENAIRQLRHGTNDETDDSDSDNDDSQMSDTTYETKKGPTPPSKWKCADPEMVAQQFDSTTIQTIQQILKARNQARRRRNYEACDAMRDELKKQYNVHLDDRLTMWWIGAAPTNVVEQVKGIGRWMDDNNDQPTSPQQQQSVSASEWRQIPTSKENDACIDPDLIFGLLQQRDIARREKDFATADTLLEQARTAPSETHLTIRIHDESRTWRVWSDDVPPRKHINNDQKFKSQLSIESPPSEQCIALCLEYAPDKVDEVRTLLLKFPGREYNILKKLKQRYLQQDS
jgi:RNA recognition motif-containing protein